MHIELAEFLRCPEPHPQTHCVVLPEHMVERDVVEGVVGCPACHREYPITDGIVRFGNPPTREGHGDLPSAEEVHALLGLTTPGGSAVMVGSAATLAPGLAHLAEGVHLIGVNAGQSSSQRPLTLLEAPASIPLRDAMARGVVLGAEYIGEPWSAEAARILLPGLRLVVLDEHAEIDGVDRLVVGEGMWVGKKNRG